MNGPMTGAQGFDADALADKGPSNEAQLPLPFDISMGTYSANLPCFGITQRGQLLWVWTGTWFVEVSGGTLAEGFMGAVMIIVVAPGIGAMLLGLAIGRRLANDLRLIARMHLLMGCIVPRTRSAGELHTNAKAQPPHAQTGETQGSIARKRSAVVHTDDLGKSLPAEYSGHGPAHGFITLVFKQAQIEQIAPVRFPYGQQILTLSITRAKPPFEVQSPDLMQRPCCCQSGVRHRRSAPCTPYRTFNQPELPQPPVDAAHRRNPSAVRKPVLKNTMELLRTPMRTLFAQRHHALFPISRLSPGTTRRPARSVPQSFTPQSLVPLKPFVTSLATDPVFQAQLLQTSRGSQCFQRKALPLQHC